MRRKTSRRPRPRPLAASEYEALAAFRRALREFLRFSEEAAGAVGLTPRQHQALLALKGSAAPGPVTIGELARRLGLKHHSAVGLVDRLAALGLVARAAAAADRRRVEVGLTARGERLLGRLSRAHRDELRRRAPVLRDLLDRIARKRPT